MTPSDKELNDAAEKAAFEAYVNLDEGLSVEFEQSYRLGYQKGHVAGAKSQQAEINDLKLALADRSEKYKQFIDSGLWSKCEEIKRLRAVLEKIKAEDFTDNLGFYRIADETLQQNGGGS